MEKLKPPELYQGWLCEHRPNSSSQAIRQCRGVSDRAQPEHLATSRRSLTRGHGFRQLLLRLPTSLVPGVSNNDQA